MTTLGYGALAQKPEVVRARHGFNAAGDTQFVGGRLDLIANRMDAAGVLLSDRLGRLAARQIDQDAGFSLSERRGGAVESQRSKRRSDRFGEPLLAR